MNKIILIVSFFWGCNAIAQPENKGSDSLTEIHAKTAVSVIKSPSADTTKITNSEDDIKAQLTLLALNNSRAIAADATVRIAEIARRKANSSMLGSVNLGGNVNEFVVNNSPAANFFPKYNLGITIPLDMFARNKAEKRTADEMIIVSTSQKILISEALKAQVLKQYEIYKEKKQLLELQRITTDDDMAAYEKAQKDYKDENITIEEVNKLYRELIISKANLVSKEKDLNIAIIDIEETIGVPLITVLEKRQH